MDAQERAEWLKSLYATVVRMNILESENKLDVKNKRDYFTKRQ